MPIPKCPNCHSNQNVILLSLGFRCAFCGKRFFSSDVVDGLKEIQVKLINK